MISASIYAFWCTNIIWLPEINNLEFDIVIKALSFHSRTHALDLGGILLYRKRLAQKTWFLTEHKSKANTF